MTSPIEQAYRRAVLAWAVDGVVPGRAEMCRKVQEGATKTPSGKTNPPTPAPVAIGDDRDAPHGSLSATAPMNVEAKVCRDAPEKGAKMCRDVQEGAAKTPSEKTNPPISDSSSKALSSRQVAAARLLALGRSARSAAAEVGVNEHTVGKWRRIREFEDEVRRQHALVLAEHVRQRRADALDTYTAVAERVMRKYGMLR
jgi:hypothetical protein